MMGGAGHGPAGHHGMAFGEPGKASDVKRTIEIEMHEDYAVTIRDNGRGIPTGPHPSDPTSSAGAA